MGVHASMDTASRSKLGTIRFGVFEVDLRAGELCKQGVKVKLQEQPFQVLQVLLERPGEVVTREELRQRIWPSDTFVDFEGGVYNAVKRLRDALGDTADTPRFVETIPRRGYRFIATVNGSALATGGSPEMADYSPEPRISRRTLRSGILIGLGFVALLLAIAGFTPNNWWQHLRGRGDASQIRSIAVLPLQNLSGDTTQEYFADAMTEELITELSRIRALRVISRTSVMRYKKTDRPLPEIARELGADGIVAGSVLRAGDRVRITAQLIYAPKDTNVWAQTYDQDLREVLAVQSAVAGAVAKEIQAEITPQEESRLKNVRAVNPKALEAYLSGRFHLDQYGKLEFYRGKEGARSEELRKALAYFDQAIEQDPQYIPPYLWFFDWMSPIDLQLNLISRVEAEVTRALQFDETSVEAHLARARLFEQYEYDWPGAEKEIKRALELSPNSAEAHYQYAQYFLCMERKEEEMKELQLAQALDPAHDYFADAGVHRIGNSLEQDRQALEEKAPNDPQAIGILARNYATAGRFKEAAELYERCLRLYGWQNFADVLKRSNKKGGPRFAIEEWMRAAEEYSKNHHDDAPVFEMAFTYANLGNKDQAFAWLDKAYAQRNWCILYLKDDPVWDPLRSDPRFKDLLRRARLPT